MTDLEREDKADAANRRTRGDHGVTWMEDRKRYRARATVGYDARGKKIEISRYGKSESAALRNLRKALREREDGLTSVKARHYTVGAAVLDWLDLGMPGRDPDTIKSYRSVANNHVIPHLGGAKINDLEVRDVENWLRGRAPHLGKASLEKARAVLRRSIRRAIVHNLATRNVAELCELPEAGKAGRPSKSFTTEQADAILTQTRSHRMHAYVVVSMLTGARTEEMRELTWDYVVLDESNGVPPHMMVWRSVRKRGETKTRKSRRTVALPRICVDALKDHRVLQTKERADAEKKGKPWQAGPAYVFATMVGRRMDVNNVRRDFRTALRRVDGFTAEVAEQWTPRELRHSFVSLMSDAGVPIEEISRLVGHSGTTVTELVYRHQIRPVVATGAEVMDRIFPRSDPEPVEVQLAVHP